MRWAVSARSPRRSRTSSRLCSALKGNQGSLRDDVELLFTEQRSALRHCRDRHDVEKSMAASRQDHTVTDDIAWLKQNHGWPAFAASSWSRRREIGAKTSARALYIASSLPMPRPRRGHPQPLEHRERASLVMDMVFRTTNAASERRMRRPIRPVKHMASNLLRRARQGQPPRQAPPRRWDDDSLQPPYSLKSITRFPGRWIGAINRIFMAKPGASPYFAMAIRRSPHGPSRPAPVADRWWTHAPDIRASCVTCWRRWRISAASPGRPAGSFSKRVVIFECRRAARATAMARRRRRACR